jgi:hypothetical protein
MLKRQLHLLCLCCVFAIAVCAPGYSGSSCDACANGYWFFDDNGSNTVPSESAPCQACQFGFAMDTPAAGGANAATACIGTWTG